jgi:hypothetical protein
MIRELPAKLFWSVNEISGFKIPTAARGLQAFSAQEKASRQSKNDCGGF